MSTFSSKEKYSENRKLSHIYKKQIKKFMLCTWLHTCTHIWVAGVIAGLHPGRADDSTWLLLLALRLMPYSFFLRKVTAWSVRVSDNHLMSPELHVTCGEELLVRSKVNGSLYRKCVICSVRDVHLLLVPPELIPARGERTRLELKLDRKMEFLEQSTAQSLFS